MTLPCQPRFGADRRVMLQRVERAFGRGDHLDIEALEQRARAEGIGGQRSGDRVEIEIRRFALRAARRCPNASANTQSSQIRDGVPRNR